MLESRSRQPSLTQREPEPRAGSPSKKGPVLLHCVKRANRICYNITRTKTSIRYAKEYDRKKRERKKGRTRDIEREGEIIEREKVREVKWIER